MIYLSDVLGGKVRDSADVIVGKVKDLVIAPQAGRYSPLLFLVIADKKADQDFFVPFAMVASVARKEVVLKNVWTNMSVSTQEPSGIWLGNDVLDEQIVDLKDARVVRVNDLKLGVFENEMCVLGIDVSVKGILRRLGISGLDIFDVFKVNLIDWRKAQTIKGGTLQLNTVSENLTRLHPADLANIIEDLSIRHGSDLVDSLDSEAAAQVVEELDPEMQRILIHYLGPERAGDIVDQMSIDETVDLFHMLPKEEAKKFLSYLRTNKTKKVERLIRYPDDTAGGLMTTDYVEAEPDWTVAQVIAEIKRVSPQMRSILYVYITDANDSLYGTISLRTLITAGPKEVLRDIVKPVPESSLIRVHESVEQVVKIMTKYNLFTAAVVDENGVMLGILTIDDIMRHLFPNA